MDLDARPGALWAVERWRPDDGRPEVVADRLAWQPSAAVPPLEVELQPLLDEVELWAGQPGERDAPSP